MPRFRRCVLSTGLKSQPSSSATLARTFCPPELRDAFFKQTGNSALLGCWSMPPAIVISTEPKHKKAQCSPRSLMRVLKFLRRFRAIGSLVVPIACEPPSAKPLNSNDSKLPKSFHRHLDQRIVQSTLRGITFPASQVLRKRLWHVRRSKVSAISVPLVPLRNRCNANRSTTRLYICSSVVLGGRWSRFQTARFLSATTVGSSVSLRFSTPLVCVRQDFFAPSFQGVAKSRKNDSKIQLVGANLRRIRNLRALTQERLAELSDLHYRSIQKIEAGEMTILVTTLYRLRDALKCEWSDLLGE